MFKSSLCLLFTVVFMSVAFAQRHTDVQSLEYEFGRSVSPAPVPSVTVPCPCAKPVVYAPVSRGYCCTPRYTPCYTPVPHCYPAPKVYRRAFVRPVYSPRYCW